MALSNINPLLHLACLIFHFYIKLSFVNTVWPDNEYEKITRITRNNEYGKNFLLMNQLSKVGVHSGGCLRSIESISHRAEKHSSPGRG